MRCAVLGSPIAHSLSPVLHRAAYAHLGLDWTYDAVEVDSPASAIRRGARRDLARPFADDAAQARGGPAGRLTRRVGAARRRGQHAAARERTTPGVQHRRAWCGGGHRRTRACASSLRCGDRWRSHRDGAPARARRAGLPYGDPAGAGRGACRGDRDRGRHHPRAPQLSVSTIDGAIALEADLVASTVPAAAQTPGLLAACADIATVFEAVYDPWPTPLALWALESGRPLVRGLDLSPTRRCCRCT